jgi:ribonuclease HI
MTDENALNIYTDGSCFSSPRRGGIGIIFVFPYYMNKEKQEFAPEGYIGATNNEMELKACIMALKQVSKFSGLQQISGLVQKRLIWGNGSEGGNTIDEHSE